MFRGVIRGINPVFGSGEERGGKGLRCPAGRFTARVENPPSGRERRGETPQFGGFGSALQPELGAVPAAPGSAAGSASFRIYLVYFLGNYYFLSLQTKLPSSSCSLLVFFFPLLDALHCRAAPRLPLC